MSDFLIILIPYFGRQNITQIVIIPRGHIRSIQQIAILIHILPGTPLGITIHIADDRDYIFTGGNPRSSTHTHSSIGSYATRCIIRHQRYHNPFVSANRAIQLPYFQMLCTERLK